jgi:hypothetical protein
MLDLRGRDSPPWKGDCENENGCQDLGLTLSLLTLGSCMGQRVAYLKRAMDQATPLDVLTNFGQPDLTNELAGGDTAWLYRIGSPQACVGYILIFGQEKVSRDWRQETC